MICYCCRLVCVYVCMYVCMYVCVCVCPMRELWPDRSRFEHPVWSRRCCIHPDIRHKKNIRKFHHIPPYFGGEMGRGYGKCGKERTKVRLSRPLRKILMFSLRPDVDTNSLHCMPHVRCRHLPQNMRESLETV
jgi:hypothetical protein